VVILRLPEMLRREWTRDCRALLEIDSDGQDEEGGTERFSLAFPGSHCPKCRASIRPWQNIPVLSYLILRGRCANCEAPIGLRYPFVELATAVATVAVGLLIPWGPALAAYLLLTWCLIALTGIYIDTQLLPDDLTVPLLWAGLLFNLTVGPVSLRDAVLGATGGYLLLWAVYWLFRLATGKEGMGFGDFKLLAALGAWLGWQALPLIILLSSVVGAVLGIILITARGQSRHQPLPFGPYLAVAGWVTLLWGDRIANALLPGFA
jgi:leader peptidase (prepilin peptidase)/N-methyltransferase